MTLDFRLLAELVRLPAALSAPGDPLLGAAASGARRGPLRAAGLGASSSLLYLGGMALNDYADREVDAKERPGRPIPSGRISARRALRVGQGLLAGGVVVAGIAGGKRSVLSATLLAGTICTYDFVAKGTRAGPFVMAGCRWLDVMHGAASVSAALVPATVVGAHTLAITGVSAFEVEGGEKTIGMAALAACAAVTAAGLGYRATRRGRSRLASVVSVVAAGIYAVPYGRASYEAIADPSPQKLQKIVGKGVMGMIPLQGSMIAGAGRPLVGSAVTSLWAVGRRLSKKRSVT